MNNRIRIVAAALIVALACSPLIAQDSWVTPSSKAKDKGSYSGAVGRWTPTENADGAPVWSEQRSLILPGSTCQTTTLRFDELPTQPVHGLSFMGVSFEFTINGTPSTDASYNGGGPGGATFVSIPALEGNGRGVLTLTFDTPTTFLSFGLGLMFDGTLMPGFVVTLFDSALQPIATFPVDTHPLPGSSEAQFNFSGTAVKKATITISPFSTRFALDNLTFCVGGGNTFDLCLQDDERKNLLRLNSVTGEYQLAVCGGPVVGGTGRLSVRGCTLTLEDTSPDRRLLVRVDTCRHLGTASFQNLALGTTLTIVDRDTTKNTCTCP